MSVYVGVSMWPFGRMMMCHMVADHEHELDEMAEKLGLRRWKQEPKSTMGPASPVHYDVCKSKRAEAISLGAIPLDDIDAEVEVLHRIVQDRDTSEEPYFPGFDTTCLQSTRPRNRIREGDRAMNGIERIAAERQRQIEVEGWTPEHDDQHINEELASAAAYYALPSAERKDLESTVAVDLWPWDSRWCKLTPDDRIRELEKAGALIAAEIDRLRRLSEKERD
jgi:hypothetical protein